MKCACVSTGPKKEVAFSFGAWWDPTDICCPKEYYQSREPFDNGEGEADQIYVDELPEKVIPLINWNDNQWKVYGTMVFVFQRRRPCKVFDGSRGINLGEFDYVDHFESLFLLRINATFYIPYDQKTGEFGEVVHSDVTPCINERTGEIEVDRWSAVIYENFRIHRQHNSFTISHMKPGGILLHHEKPRILDDWHPSYGKIFHIRGSYIHIGNHKYDINSSLKRSIMLLRLLPDELKRMLFEYLVLLIY